jgi:ABC-2 type transport system permease protein
MKLLKVTYYKLKMMLCDRLFFAAMIIIPLFITIATGYALRYEKLNTIPVAFVDEDQSSYSAVLLQRLSGKEGLRVRVVSRDAAVSMLEGSKAEEIFIIKQGFEDKIQKGDCKELIDLAAAPSSSSSGFASEVVAGEAIRLITGDMAAEWVSTQYKKLGKTMNENFKEEIIKYNDSLWEPKPLMTITYKELQGKQLKEVNKVSMPVATASSTGIIIAFMMFYVLFSSGWLVEERTNGTVKRLAAGPRALDLSYTGNILALLISGFIQVILFSSVDKFIFGVDLFPGSAAYLVFFLYLLSVISISLFLSSILKTPAQLQAAAPILALMTGFAGGCFWNFVEMPERIKQLSMLTPQGWALNAINKLLVNPADIASIFLPAVILSAISLVLLPLSYYFIRVQIKS